VRHWPFRECGLGVVVVLGLLEMTGCHEGLSSQRMREQGVVPALFASRNSRQTAPARPTATSSFQPTGSFPRSGSFPQEALAQRATTERIATESTTAQRVAVRLPSAKTQPLPADVPRRAAGLGGQAVSYGIRNMSPRPVSPLPAQDGFDSEPNVAALPVRRTPRVHPHNHPGAVSSGFGLPVPAPEAPASARPRVIRSSCPVDEPGR